MKTRIGFVSNSSSSNFIVAFPHKPISIDDTFEMMFPSYSKETPVGEYDYKMTAYDIAKEIFDSLNSSHIYEENVGELTRFMLVELISKQITQDAHYSEYDNESDDLNKYPEIRELTKTSYYISQKYIHMQQDTERKSGKKANLIELYQREAEELEPVTKKLDELILVEAQRQADEFLKDPQKYFVAGFHFSDSNPKESVMEHSNIFMNLPVNIRISNH